jgi:hypothetical protein
MWAHSGMLRYPTERGGGGTITIFSEGKSQGRDFSQKRVEEDHKTCGRGRVEY